MTFQDYLYKQFENQTDGVLNDDAKENFEDWLDNNLMREEYIAMANDYAKIQWKKGRDELLLLQKLQRESQEEGDESSGDVGDFSGASDTLTDFNNR